MNLQTVLDWSLADWITWKVVAGIFLLACVLAVAQVVRERHPSKLP